VHGGSEEQSEQQHAGSSDELLQHGPPGNVELSASPHNGEERDSPPLEKESVAASEQDSKHLSQSKMARYL
jgi:hypothetical protein